MIHRGTRLACLTLLLIALAGCSAVRFTYDRGPTLLFWWLDDYLALEPFQQARTREDIAIWFAWHRREALPAYAGFLAEVAGAMPGEIPAARVCGWRDQITTELSRAFDAAIPPLATLMVSLGIPQLEHLAQRFEETNRELEDEYGAGPLASRIDRSRKRTERFLKRLYGPLSKAQRTLVLERTAETSFDPVRWLEERGHRQALVMEGMQRLVRMRDEVPVSARMARARALLQDYRALYAQSPRADYQAYREALIVRNCALIAEVHALATAAQRAHAVERLGAWERDFRTLAAGADRD